ncbi:MAG: ribonuclease catalytic domain-containing protein [Thermodesulfobacteriota bacterium]
MIDKYPRQIEQGCIVEYLQENQTIIGCAIETAQKNFRLLNINKRLLKLPVSRVLPWQGPVVENSESRESILEAIVRHDRYRTSLEQQLDPQEIWELLQGELSEGSIDWLATLVWTEPDIDSKAALGRALLSYKLHFKFNPPNFVIYDRETVEEKKRQEEAKRKEANLISYGQEFLKALWDKQNKGGHIQVPSLSGEIESELKALLLKGVAEPENAEFLRLWKQVSKNLPPQEHLPLILCQLWGILPPHHNYLLDQAEYVWGDEWAKQFQEEISRHEEEISVMREQNPPEQLSLVSVDSSTTTDIDDAFALQETSSGYRVHLAFACPSLVWDFNSELNREVASRCSSLYLPEGTTHMLPERLSSELYSLHARENKPVLLLDISLDADANIENIHTRLTWSKLEHNLTYSQLEDQLQRESRPYYNLALQLAHKLKQKRLDNGAVIFDQKEPIVKVTPQDNGDDVEVSIKEPASNPRAQLIVSELMILANMAASKWSQEKGIPLLHRSQEINISPESKGVWSDPVDIFNKMREMSSSIFSVQPGFHTSLGVNCYAPMTSPLRRYPDLLNMGQIIAHLIPDRTPWSGEELKANISRLNSRMQTITKIQRYRLRYWKLLYFKRWCKISTWNAIVVSKEDKMITVALPRENIFLRAPSNIFGEKVYVGKEYRVQLGKINPLDNEIKIQKAWEE